ncbi:sulfotransferase family 2 domain-containing protein [Bauldia sp.]|uniref:sulfotransferase family 2 domain-containing protein n=1 Tax=Bauldia sp. TaxID=2575872 RepID=UPI003BAC6784
MFLDSKRIIFVHIPKTAGNFLQRHLLEYSSDHCFVKPRQDGIERFEVSGVYTPTKHARLEDYRSAMPNDLFGRCRIMTSVRHPFDRFLSLYHSPHRWISARDGIRRHRTPVFDEVAFFELVRTQPPMASWFYLDGVPMVPEDIVRFEHLQHDIRTLFPRLELDVPQSFAPINASNVDTSKLRASRRLEDAVLQHHEEDYRVFGYGRLT